jgi:hypothetical protein
MKTQVIQLDPHDDAVSVRDRMSWAKSSRILLVYPRRSFVLSRTLDLHLLQRHAAALGGQLAIVAHMDEIRQTARELGIPIFKTAAIAQRRTWPEPPPSVQLIRRMPRPDLRQMQREAFPPEASWRKSLAVRILFFSLAVLAVVTLLLLFLPSATVAVVPETRVQNLTISASASPKVDSVSLTGSLPARLVFSVIERNKTAPVTGSLVIPNTSAVGLAQFSNFTTGEVLIPAGTVIGTLGDPPVRFATTVNATAAAGVGKKIDVPVEAVEAGSSGNLPAETLVAIQGDLGTSLSVTNPSPTTGGTDQSAPVQTADDRSRLRASLVSEILAQCKIDLPKSISQVDTFFPDTLDVGQVFSETYFPAEGQTGATLSLTMNVQCQAQYASLADVNSLARLALDANLPDGFEPVTAELTTTDSSAPVTDANGITHWEVQAQRLLQARIDALEVTRLIQGHRPIAAGQRLAEALPLAKAPTIEVTPAWWPWLPILPFRTSVSTGE